MSIFLISDSHFGHNREFIYKDRGFTSIEEHDNAIIQRWNLTVKSDDTVYHLGDVMLGDNEYGLNCLSQLKGKIHIIRGNHDTNTRIELYRKMSNVVEVTNATYLHYKKYYFYLTHYPCITGCLTGDSLKKMTCNLYGHTHQKDRFYKDMPFMYNVGVDSHYCFPVEIDEVIEEMEDKVRECMRFL
jgi:calcineurin-like phosphoesterase family protein